MNILKKIIRWFLELLVRDIPDESRIDLEVKIPVTKSETIEEMVRRVCKEKRLSTNDTEIVVATIKGESGMDPKAVHANEGGTFDAGLCQMNSKFYLRDDVMSENPRLNWHGIAKWWRFLTMDQAFDDPELCVNIMCRRLLEGGMNDWIVFRSGKYREFMPKVV